MPAPEALKAKSVDALKAKGVDAMLHHLNKLLQKSHSAIVVLKRAHPVTPHVSRALVALVTFGLVLLPGLKCSFPAAVAVGTDMVMVGGICDLR